MSRGMGAMPQFVERTMAYALAHGRNLVDMSLDELEDLWQQAKTAA